jgi:glycosyltransferase involved in cell wall biosynthesis
MIENYHIAVVIPCFKVANHISGLINEIPHYVDTIIVVDDKCPQGSGEISQKLSDPRINVIFNNSNLGVGGATKAGYAFALTKNIDIVVKLDGDGQMDPSRIRDLVSPICRGESDYAKGNRFGDVRELRRMPPVRLVGNFILSFFAKASSGYWKIFDPNNGYTAISTQALKLLDFEKISNRYFFESDMLYSLNICRAKVIDVYIPAIYRNEQSNLKIRSIFLEFLGKHTRNLFKRIFFTYFVYGFNIVSLNILIGLPSLLFSIFFGLKTWWKSSVTGIPSPMGALFLTTIFFSLGLQLTLSFLNYDLENEPKNPLFSGK